MPCRQKNTLRLLGKPSSLLWRKGAIVLNLLLMLPSMNTLLALFLCAYNQVSHRQG